MDGHYENNLSINIDGSSINIREAPQNMGIYTRKKHSPSLENLFSNRDVLARRLKNRPHKEDLIDRNIIPAHAHTSAPTIFDKVAQLERRKTGDILTKKIRARPNRQQLIQRHILSVDAKVDPSLLEKVGKLERQRIADQLNERLLTRPGPIELIQDRILPVESPIQHAIEQGTVEYENTVSPASSHTDSPSVSELETGINTLNCTSPSPPPLTSDAFGDSAFRTQLKSVSDANSNITSLYMTDPRHHHIKSSQISISQKENERLVKSLNKKSRQPKPKVKKLKFHECQPASMSLLPNTQESNEAIDERYKRLLEQQTLYLRLQVMQQNAVMNALQGNTESMEAVNEEIENMISKEQQQGGKGSENQILKCIDNKKFDDLRVIDLRAQLKQRGLLVSGSKAKLIERLSAFEEGKASPADFAYSNNCFMHDASKVTSLPSDTNAPVTTMMQVTAYATNSGQTYQLIQTLPQASQSMMQYQVLPTQCTTNNQTMTQPRLDQVNALPVVAVTEPSIVTVQERLNDKKSAAQNATSPPPADIQFQLTPPPQPVSPTVVLHSGPPLQQASLLQRQKSRVQVRKLPVISQGECYIHDNASFSQSGPSMKYNYLLESHQQQRSSNQHSTNLNYQNSLSHTNLNREGSVDGSDVEFDHHQQQQFRGRASSDSQLKRLHRNDSNTKSVYSNQLKISGSTSPSPGLSSLPGLYYDQRQLSKESMCSVKTEAYDDIMDIIGELSSPAFSSKSENPPPYNSCLFDDGNKPQKEQPNKFFSNNPIQQQHQTTSFKSSIPENMNLLAGSPSHNFLTNLSYSNTNNLPYQQQQQLHNNFNNLSHASSTGSIPQQTDMSGLSTSPFHSPGTPSTFINCNAMSPMSATTFINCSSMSPMSATTEDIMDLDKFPTQNNTWLDLNMDTGTSPSNRQDFHDFHTGILNSPPANMSNTISGGYPAEYQHIYNNPRAIYGAQNRSQTSIHGSSPKPQDGFISLFDLEGGGY